MNKKEKIRMAFVIEKKLKNVMTFYYLMTLTGRLSASDREKRCMSLWNAPIRFPSTANVLTKTT